MRTTAPTSPSAPPPRPAAIAMLPVAEEHKKILIVEPAVADQITGDKWNRYIFRTARNSSQDAISNAVAIGKPGVHVAHARAGLCVRPRRRRRVQGRRLAKTGATLATEEYAPANTTDFTAVGAAPVRRAEGQARQEDDLVHLGGRRQSARQARRPRSRPLRHRASPPAAIFCPRSPPTSAFPASRAPPIITTASRRTRSTIGWSPNIRSASTRRRISSPAAASRRRWRWSPRSRRRNRPTPRS